MKTRSRLSQLSVIAAVLAVGTACDHTKAASSDWAALGEFIDGGEPALDPLMPSIAIDPTVDRPVVSVHESPGGTASLVRVRAWTGSEWSLLGQASSSSLGGFAPRVRASDVTVSADGTVWLAWVENDPRRTDAQNVYVAKWEGAAWALVGENLATYPIIEDLDPGNTALDPSIVVDATGAPWVAWIESGERGSSPDVQVKRFDGVAWQAVGPEALATDDRDDAVCLLFDGEQRPVIVSEKTSAGAVTSVVAIQRWESDTWTPIGELSGGDHGYERAPDAAFAPNGADLYVAYRGGPAGAYRLYVDHWDGQQWAASSEPVDDGDGADVGTATIAVDSQARPVVSWSQQRDGQASIQAKRRSGSTWEALGGELDDTSGFNFGAVIAVDASDAPIVVWDDGSSGERHATARRWTGDE